MRRWAPAVAALALLAGACKEERPPSPPPNAAPPARARAQPPGRFTTRDLALATAVDARAAKLSFVGSDAEATLLAPGARGRAPSKDLLLRVEVARAELDAAVRAVENPGDRALAQSVAALARRYAGALAEAAGSGAPSAALALARRDLGDAIGRYRQSRAAWRLDVAEPSGPERVFAGARRDLERAEAELVARAQVTPGDVAALVGRARAAADRLPAPLADPAARYVTAQARVLAAALAGARETAEARAYHAAKADALAALADWHAAGASR